MAVSSRLANAAARLAPAAARLRPALRGRRGAWLAAGAVAAGATAAWTHRRARRAEREHPPIGRFVDADGVRLHCLDAGDGPPVVILPGNAVVVQDAIGSGLIERLAAAHRVVAFDRPGFGHSARPRDRLWTASAQAGAIRAAMASLGIERAVLVGHSWGTLVAMALAQRHPDAVQGLVLVSGYYYPSVRLDVPVAATAALPVVGDALRYTVSPLVARASLGRMVRAMFSPQPVPPQFWPTTPRELMLRPSQLRADAEDAAFMVPDVARLQSGYAALPMPVRIFAGGGDLIVDPRAHSARLHDEVPGSILTVLPDAGHMVHYEAPGEIAAAVGELWRGGAPGGVLASSAQASP